MELVKSTTQRVAEAISVLPPGHSRKEAYALINALGIKNSRGAPIIAAVWYTHVTQHAYVNNETYMQRYYPEFVQTPAYSAASHAQTKVVEIQDSTLIRDLTVAQFTELLQKNSKAA